MAYYSGQASSYQELLGVLINACELNGYSYENNILYKDSIFLRTQAADDAIDFWGRTSLTSADTPNAVRVGKFGRNKIQPSVVFPVLYEIFIGTDEVYLIFKYSIIYYQWLAFGKTNLQVGGTGMYLSASLTNLEYSGWNGVSISSNGLITSFEVCPAFSFCATIKGNYYYPNNSFIHTSIDEDSWLLNNVTGSDDVGIRWLSQLIDRSPSYWSEESVLLPMCIYKRRSSDKVSLVLELKNARNIRLDNLEPEQIITLGQDRWKIFPWYSKNINGKAGGTGLTHTGTFGWAIRYDGP